MLFNIVRIMRVSLSTVRIDVTLDAKAWHKAKRLGHLGQLYGVDISNAVFRAFSVKAYQPTVDDKAKARNGVKTVSLFYQDAAWVDKPSTVIRVDFSAKAKAA